MKILFQSSENLDKRSLYIHTRDQKAKSLKDVEDGTVIDPKEIVIYEDEDRQGNTQVITSVIDMNGTHYATNSRFFREELGNIYEIMKPEPFKIAVVKNVSKNGRTFVTCTLL